MTVDLCFSARSAKMLNSRRVAASISSRASAQLQDRAGIHNILRCRAPVNKFTGIAVADFLYGADKWHDGMARSVHFALHLVEIEKLYLGFAAYFVRCRLRYHT